MKRRVVISALSPTDCKEFVAAAQSSRRMHIPWVSPPLTAAAYRARLRRLAAPSNYAFAIRRLETNELAGCIEITNIVRGVFLSGYVSYYAFSGFERQGLMTEGLQRVVRHAFRTLKLHRLEANIQPGNEASIALVRACGFHKEGYSPRYLKIRGRWRDHERWAMVSTDTTRTFQG